MVSLVKGKHTLSLGGEFALDKTMFWADLLNFGTIGFATSAPTSTNNVFSDWVTGQPSSFEQDTPYTTLISYWHYAAFAQDDYRITPRFTANLGIRWDIDTAPVESLNRTASFSPGVQSTVTPIAPKGLLFPGDPRHRSRHHLYEIPSSCAASRFRMGPKWGRQNRISRRRGRLLWHYQRQRVEPARQRRAIRHTSGLRSSQFDYQYLLDTGRLSLHRTWWGYLPVRLFAKRSEILPVGLCREHRQERAISLHLPVQRVGAATIARPDEFDGRVCRHALA